MQSLPWPTAVETGFFIVFSWVMGTWEGEVGTARGSVEKPPTECYVDFFLGGEVPNVGTPSGTPFYDLVWGVQVFPIFSTDLSTCCFA